MAQLAGAFGTSHEPMLSTPPNLWGLRRDADFKNPRHFFRAKTPLELRAALETAIAAGEPRLIEVPCGPMASPWRHIHLPRVRGQAV